MENACHVSLQTLEMGHLVFWKMNVLKMDLLIPIEIVKVFSLLCLV